jgi:ATP-dependent DNA ligase
MHRPAVPILTAPTERLPSLDSYAAEPKWDGFRALLSRLADGRVDLRSRQGTPMTGWFPEIAAAAAGLPGGNRLLDGEVVLWADNKLDFGRLLARVNRSGAQAARLAAATPCHFVVFDLSTTTAPTSTAARTGNAARHCNSCSPTTRCRHCSR